MSTAAFTCCHRDEVRKPLRHRQQLASSLLASVPANNDEAGKKTTSVRDIQTIKGALNDFSLQER